MRVGQKFPAHRNSLKSISRRISGQGLFGEKERSVSSPGSALRKQERKNGRQSKLNNGINLNVKIVGMSGVCGSVFRLLEEVLC